MESYEIPEEMAEVLPETCPSRRFTTCAVVGNSGTTLFEQFGREIDAHQMVYRFNQVRASLSASTLPLAIAAANLKGITAAIGIR